ncbi:MAG: hypothetical protein K0Q79_3321 [Flavipsychrobacter sp.]|jgi:hypothetical protein|nr:hypothetical protein [Flavipsychrobacter sp.]
MQKDILKKLLLRTQHRSRLWAALAALCTGTTLLLTSVLIWWNFNELLYGKNQNDALGSTYLIIGKKVTQQSMAIPGATRFSAQEISELSTAPQVQEVGIIGTNHFPVYATLGGELAFATDMPLECVPDKFIDNLPADWKWEPGNPTVPIIVSSQFLDIYNYVFAPSQGLPQLSESSVKLIVLNLTVGSAPNTEKFMARVVGFSGRIGSVLVPKSFIDYGNQKFGTPQASGAVSQLILKTADPSDTKFADYLKQHNYNTNTENLRWSKIRSIVEVVTSATGVLALLLMGIGTLVFILFIELTIARAQQSLTLLLQIGYGPQFVSRFMINRFLPMVIATVVVAMLLAIAGQAFVATTVTSQGLVLPYMPGWPVWVAMLISTMVLVLLVGRSISTAIKKQ